jgi:cellulose synthase/poly-beta-1,6-N-acetylglucosamine synthase-like glycosyltransferase
LTGVAIGLAIVSLALAVWSYVVYPPFVLALSRRAASRPAAAPSRLSVEVVLSAANEESVIADRVRNLLDQSVAASYRVTLGCDGSTDRTAEVARKAGDSRLTILEFRERRGKATVLNDLVAASESALLVFTDANTRFEEGAVERLTSVFADSQVGAACGRLILDAGETESAFWDRETRLKEAEGRLGVCLGANGAIYAARREEIEPLPADSAMDDFLIPLHVARRGRKVVFVGDAMAREEGPGEVRDEMGRRFRIGVGAGQVLRRETWLFAFWRHPMLTFAFLSRKFSRWIAPVAALAAVAAACASPSLRVAGGVVAGLVVLIALSVFTRPHPRGIAGRLYYFAVMNLALSIGVLAGLLGASRAIWKPAKR